MRIVDEYDFSSVPNIEKALNLIDEDCEDFAIIGGAVRFMAKSQPWKARDFDIVVDSMENLKKDPRFNYPFKLNTAGGHKYQVGSYEMDIWELGDTYGIKKGYYPKSFLSLKDTTILNYDSAIYYKNEFSGYYKDFLLTGKLDLVGMDSGLNFNSNFNPLGTIAKVVELQREMGKYGFAITSRLALYLNSFMDMLDISKSDIDSEIERHYGILTSMSAVN